jgi:hypothetical protein
MHEELIKDLRQAIYRKEKFEEICEKLTDKVTLMSGHCGIAGVSGAPLSEDVAVFVEDYYGGRVIKQEATPVTIIDREGKATYAVTKRELPKGTQYHLVICK